MTSQHVCDTNSIIWYFEDVFGEASKLSTRAKTIINQAFQTNSQIRLTIPSIVFIEIHAKWCTTEEQAAKIVYEVYEPIKDCENIAIREINSEVLQNLLRISGSLTTHDLHDKIVLANAMMLNCPLLTSDGTIIKYVAEHKVIPSTI